MLGLAISAGTSLCFAAGSTSEVRLASDEFTGELRFDLRAPEAVPGPAWGRYARGAAWALRERLPARSRGLVGRVSGALPGAGLGSSASVLLAYQAFPELADRARTFVVESDDGVRLA